MTRVEKPWGFELIWAHTEKYAGKILHISAGHSLSLQYHEQKEEVLAVRVDGLDVLVAAEPKVS